MKQFDVVTLFPGMFEAVAGYGVTQRARNRGLYQLVLWNPRDYAANAYRSVDDRPYGGGPGMVMMAEPLAAAIRAARQRQASCGVRRNRAVYLSPQGRPLDQNMVERLGEQEGLVLLAGRYEGVDQRFIDRHVDEQLSLGDFVLSGGEIPAMALLDAVARLQPGVLNDQGSHQEDSFNPALDGLLDCPHYTRPEVWEGKGVPATLLSGHHAQIERWRRERRLEATARLRPELVEAARAAGRLDAADEAFLASLS